MLSLQEERRWRWIGAGLLLTGIGLRIVTFVRGRSLGIDEAMLALNVVTRSWGELFGKPLFEQVIPPLFLIAEKASVSLFRASDTSLRLVPVAGAILLLIFLWRFCLRVLGERGAALALVLAISSPLLFRFGDEVKQYGIEALASVIVMHLALRVRDAPAAARWAGLLCGGLLALAVSLTAYFVAPGVIAGLLAAPEIRNVAHQRRLLVGLAVAWAIAAGFLYFGYYGPTAENPYFARYWGGAYPVQGLVRTPVRIMGFGLEFLGRLLQSEGGSPLPLRIPLGLAAAAGFGSLLVRRRWTIAAMFGVPLLLAAAAAAVHRYPLSARLWLFSAPIAILLIVCGIEWVVRVFPTRRSLAAGGLAVACGLVALPEVYRRLSTRAVFDPAPMKAVMQVWESSVRTGDATYVGNRTIPAWIFYSTDWRRPEPGRLAWLLRESQALGPNAGNIPSRGRPVEREGDSLIWTGAHGPELLGIPTGAEATMDVVVLRPADQGWAENEARRILAAASECVWVIHASGPAPHRVLLRTAVEAAAGPVVAAWQQGRGTVLGIRTPGTTRECEPHH